MIQYIALGASILLNAISLILMKSYAISPRASDAETPPLYLFDIRLIASIVLYGFAGMLWLIALTALDLMVAYPSLALTYVGINLVSPRLFAEEVSPRRWAGALLIVTGVVVLNL